MVTMPMMGVFSMPQAVVTIMAQRLRQEMLLVVVTIWWTRQYSLLKMASTLEQPLLEYL